MMGLRGCRLGITFPAIVEMQVKAILRAALALQSKGFRVFPEIMVPLIASVEEVCFLRKLVDEKAAQLFAVNHNSVTYKFGAMIELPRAAVCAASIAQAVDFISFGTNDLTQMTFGFSRDDSYKYLETYLDLGILKRDPFLTIDCDGVGALMRMAVLQARAANPTIKIGVCGEHGGDPESIGFFHSLGVDYVSCSPARIPVAQLALAQVSLLHQEDDSAPPVREFPPQVLS